MAPLDGSILSVALPAIGKDLRLSFEGTLWVQASYLLAMAVLLVPMGRLADQYGRMRIYLAGTALFMLGSIGAAVSTGANGIVLSRVLQGCGGSMLGTSATAIVVSAFPPNMRGRAMGINVMSVYVGLSLGPPLGGFLVENFSWHWIFLINIPIGAATLLWGWRLRKAVKEQLEERRMDVAGALLLGAAMLTLILPLTLHSRWGWESPITWACLAVSAISFAAFVSREKKAPDPLLDMDLLRRNPPFALGNLAALLNYLAIHAVGLLTSVWLQLVQGMTAGHAGWLMLGAPVMQSAVSPLAGRLADRMGERALTAFGTFMTGLGMALLAIFSGGAGMPAVVGALMVVGLGMASFSAPNTSAVMGSVERHHLGLASAFLGLMRVSGMVLSVALLGGLAARRLGPGGWQSLLEHGPGGPGAAAFVQGYRAAMLTGACFSLLAVFACLAKKKKGASPGP
jgi:EmrB/QacA subfamily drug resistance transporter